MSEKIGESIPLNQIPGIGMSSELPEIPKPPQIGESTPITNIDFSKRISQTPLKNKPVLTHEKPKETIIESAKSDFRENLEGFKALGKMIIGAANPSLDENTIAVIGKSIHDSIKQGTFLKDTGGLIKGMVMPPLERAAEVSGELASGDIKGAAETIARRPFTFAMDLSSLLGVAKPTIKIGEKAGKYGASIIAGPSSKKIAERIANSAVIKNARPYEQIASDIPSAMKTLQAKISKADDIAWKTLSKDVADGYPPEVITDLIEATKKNMGKLVSDADVKAAKTLDVYKKRIVKQWMRTEKNPLTLNEEIIPTTISPSETRSIIQQLSHDIDYEKGISEPTNNAVKILRHSVDDLLKADNPKYGREVAKVQKLIKIQEKTKKILGVKKVSGEYEIPKNIETKLSTLDKSFKELELDQLDSFADETGLDIVAESKNYANKLYFEKAFPQGAARPLVGGVVGGVVGHALGSPTTGAVIGTSLGKTADIYGGKALAGIIDTPGVAPILRGISKAGEAIPSATAIPLLIPKPKNEKEK